MANPKNRLKKLVQKAEKKLYEINIRQTQLKDILRSLRKEIQFLTTDLEEMEEDHEPVTYYYDERPKV